MELHITQCSKTILHLLTWDSWTNFLDTRTIPHVTRTIPHVTRTISQDEPLPFSRLIVNWKVWKDDWMAQLCHSETFKLPFIYISGNWMAEVHPVFNTIGLSTTTLLPLYFISPILYQWEASGIKLLWLKVLNLSSKQYSYKYYLFL